MTPEILIALVFVAGAAALLLYVLREGRKIDDLDPRAGDIIYEDVEKPAIDGVEAVESEQEPVATLYYVEHDFAVASGEITLTLQGKADRVVRKRDGAVHIIDFKSGSSGLPDKDAEQKLPDKSEYYKYQLMAYFLMVEQTYGERPSKAIIDFLDGGAADFTEIENTEEIREECLDLVRQVCEVKLGAIPDEWLRALDEQG